MDLDIEQLTSLLRRTELQQEISITPNLYQAFIQMVPQIRDRISFSGNRFLLSKEDLRNILTVLSHEQIRYLSENFPEFNTIMDTQNFWSLIIYDFQEIDDYIPNYSPETLRKLYLGASRVMSSDSVTDQLARENNIALYRWIDGELSGGIREEIIDLAVKYNSISLFNYLVSKDYHPSRDSVSYAIRNKSIEILDTLRSLGLTPGSVNLNEVVSTGDYEYLEFLYNFFGGILPNTNAVYIAFENGYFDILDWLYAHGLRGDPSIMYDIATRNPNLFQLLDNYI